MSRVDVSVTLSHVYLLSLNCIVFSTLALILDPVTKYEVSVISERQNQVSVANVCLSVCLCMQSNIVFSPLALVLDPVTKYEVRSYQRSKSKF